MAQSPPQRGKIGVVTEQHFDETEYRRFGEFFPEHGYEVEYLSHLWGQPQLSFKGNDFTAEVTVSKEIADANPDDYKAIILIGGYAMDRLRYQENLTQGQPSAAPAVEFLRRAVKSMDEGKIKIGTICHSLWLFCADPALLKGRQVTCAHNIICDVENAGGQLVFNGEQAVDTHVDGNLVTGRHPGVVDEFMDRLLGELEKD